MKGTSLPPPPPPPPPSRPHAALSRTVSDRPAAAATTSAESAKVLPSSKSTLQMMSQRGARFGTINEVEVQGKSLFASASLSVCLGGSCL